MSKIIALLQCLVYLLLTGCPAHPFSMHDHDPTATETSPELVQIGKRNFWEANAAMATVTGLTPDEQLAIQRASVVGNTTRSAGNNVSNDQNMQKITKAFQQVNTMMSRKNGIDGCDPGTQVGLFRLASAHCNRLVNDSAAWNNFVKQNFDGADVNKLSKSHVAAVMLDSLQTGSKLSSSQREKSITTIVNYMNDTSAGDSVSKETLFDVCTMVLGSASTMLN